MAQPRAIRGDGPTTRMIPFLHRGLLAVAGVRKTLLVLRGKIDLLLRLVVIVHHLSHVFASDGCIAILRLINGAYRNQLFLAGHLATAIVREQLKRRILAPWLQIDSLSAR